MKTSVNALSLIAVLVLLSCQSDDVDTSSILVDTSDPSCLTTKVFDPDFTGTACCTQRNSELSIGTDVEYEYFSNISNPDISWRVVAGDIEIISGGDSSVVTIRIGVNFEEGQLKAQGISELAVCSESIFISKIEPHS